MSVSRALWAQRARSAIAAARNNAKKSKGTSHVWVVVTSSYMVNIDPDTEAGILAAQRLASGDVAAAIDGISPSHTEVGFRYGKGDCEAMT